MMAWLRRAAFTLALVYGGAVGLVWANQTQLLHRGWQGPTAQMVADVPGLAEVQLPADPTPLRAWYREAEPWAPTLIFFHGNAGFQWRKLDAFAARGYGFLVTSYRGYAAGAGTPSEAGMMEDARAALAFAQAQGIAPEDTVLYGESLGTGVAARMAMEDGAWRTLVLDAPYTSIEDRASEVYFWLPVSLLIRDRFDTAAFIDQVETPLLILHGTEDDVIPIDHGRALLDLATEPKQGIWIEGGNHYLLPEVVAGALEGFLAAMDE